MIIIPLPPACNVSWLPDYYKGVGALMRTAPQYEKPAPNEKQRICNLPFSIPYLPAPECRKQGMRNPRTTDNKQPLALTGSGKDNTPGKLE